MPSRFGLYSAALLYGTCLVVYTAQEAGITTTDQADLPPFPSSALSLSSGTTVSLTSQAAGYTSTPPSFLCTDTVSGEFRIADASPTQIAEPYDAGRGLRANRSRDGGGGGAGRPALPSRAPLAAMPWVPGV
jgi:hypothetical protein